MSEPLSKDSGSDTPVNVLDLAERGLGSLLWVMNNRHNWADPKYDELAEAAEADGRRALEAIRDFRSAA